ncbi:MAG: Rad3-related DNA helicase [Planctomycetota bacterium]|jgi:Rad3-related DNA helicase
MGQSEDKKALEGQDTGSAPPWENTVDGVLFLTFRTHGNDPSVGEMLGLRAEIVSAGQVTAELQLECSDEAPEECWKQLTSFAAGYPLIVVDVAEFCAWNAFLSTEVDSLSQVTGLGEVAALLAPSRISNQPQELVATLHPVAKSSDCTPDQLRSALSELARRFLSRDRDTVHAISVSLATAWSRMFVTEPEAAERIGRVLTLLQSLDAWNSCTPSNEGVTSLRFESDSVETEFLPLVLAEAEPYWQTLAADWHSYKPLPPQKEGGLPWTKEDAALLDLAFTEHLPAIFAEQAGEGAASAYRASQHSVSREVAANFGHQEKPETQLLLVHAPTGTGKTLGYLLPALLWAGRHDVRVGVSTFTRALQEQAIDREVPRALEVLKRMGVGRALRVSMLKGRENYLCWRTLKLHVPAFEAAGEQWLAFCQLLAFSLTDSTGDLDRLPRRAPIEFTHNATYRSTLSELLKQVRARTSCCRAKEDKVACAAEVARWRAERSHLVVTNHSFALARQEFFRHIIFDECEHLHDQAHSAWSHQVQMHEVTSLLDRLYAPEKSRTRSLFVRIAKRIIDGSPSWETLQICRERSDEMRSTFHELQDQVGAFDTWRKSKSRERDDREDHSLLREYVESDLGKSLIVKRVMFCRVGNQLDEKLAELAERLEKLGAGRMARLRRTIDIVRTELVEIIDAVSAWLPLQEGKPHFNSRTFHDVEVDANGGLELSARVLLPNEYLGRFYYPTLSTASFLSATTFLQGGFDAATAYLGLDRAVQAADDDPDLLCSLRTFRAPEVFDYGRVLVAVPRDAPSVSRDKEGFLLYVRDFIAKLGERTNGRILALFTNAEDVKRVGARLEGHFRARNIGLLYQNMPGTTKEELSDSFRRRKDSILLGVDTFWYGADFPGDTLEHLVIVRLPYGVPDRYHHAQCGVLGIAEQRRQIYMPRALAKFRQGFGRLMRRVEDHGCVYLLDHRVVDPRHRAFLRELPIARIGEDIEGLARMVRGDTDRCFHQAMIHVGLEESARPLAVDELPQRDIERFEPDHKDADSTNIAPSEIDMEDLPF